MKTKAVKTAIIFLSLLMLLSLISACGGSEEAAAPAEQLNEAENEQALEGEEQPSPTVAADFINPLSGATFLLPGSQILFNDDFTISYSNDLGGSSEGEYTLDENYSGMAYFEGYELPIMVKNSLLFIDGAADGQFTPMPRAEGEDWDLDPNDTYSTFAAAWDNDEAAHSIELTANNRYIISSHDFLMEGSYTLNHGTFELTLYLNGVETTVSLMADYSFSIPDLAGTFMQVEYPYYTLSFADGSAFPSEVYTVESLFGAWDNDNIEVSMYFYADGQVEISSYEDFEVATYQYDAKLNELIISHQGGELYGYIEEGFGDLIFEGLEGYFYQTREAWYTPQ